MWLPAVVSDLRPIEARHRWLGALHAESLTVAEVHQLLAYHCKVAEGALLPVGVAGRMRDLQGRYDRAVARVEKGLVGQQAV